MRISEKTVELNLCAQITKHFKGRIIWFGLTQAQEARSGFDAATKLGGLLILFQFKASNKTMKRTGARRFYLEHSQLEKLIGQVNGYRRSVFYVFPMIGNTLELSHSHGDFFNCTWLLDLCSLPDPFPPPTTNTTPMRFRKNQLHYADILPPNAIIHSDPFKVGLINLKKFVNNKFEGSDGLIKLLLNPNEEKFEIFLDKIEPFRKDFKLAIIY